MTRILGLLIAAGFAGLPALAEAAETYQSEPNTYRSGGAFMSVPDREPDACAALCESDYRCKAWVYIPAGWTSQSRCDMKTFLGAAEPRPGFHSGVSTKLQPESPIDTEELLGGPSAKTDVRAARDEDIIFTIDPVPAR